MTRIMVWLAVLAFAVLPQAARAQDNGAVVFAAFRDVCVSGGGDTEHALTKLRNLGWAPAPADLVTSMHQSTGSDVAVLVNFDTETGVLKTTGGLGAAVAVVGATPPDLFDGLPLSGPRCGIVPFGVEGESVRRSAEAFYGFAPVYKEGGATMWIYTQTNGQIRSAADFMTLDEATAMARVRAAPLFVFGVVEAEGVVVLLSIRVEG